MLKEALFAFLATIDKKIWSTKCWLH